MVMPPRGRIVVALAVMAAASVAFIVLLPRHSAQPARAKLSVPEARAQARLACDLTGRLLHEIYSDGATRTVLDLADRASDAAGDAAFGNPQWVLLASSVQALSKSLHANDARLAAFGMRQIGQQCAGAGVTLPETGTATVPGGA
jgi:hypothetical protein